MSVMSGDLIQILHIRFITDLPLKFSRYILIFFFEYSRIFSITAIIIVTVVQTILSNFIDEEQAEHLDAFGVKLSLPADMGTNGFPDLDTSLKGSHLLVALNLSSIKLQAVEKSNRVISTINAVRQDDIAIGVFFQPVG